MLPRHARHTLQALASGFPVLAITGPRQSGKTTLARSAFPQLPYVNLEDPDTRELALADPRRFLARLAGGAVLDEVQRAPALMACLLGMADSAPQMGRWVLAGSQQFGWMDGIDQSLAGRVGTLTLLPLCHAELPPAATLEQRLWRGGYPALHAEHRDTQAAHWFAGYLLNYIEREVRQLLNVSNLLTFQRFVSMCAARSGQLLNLNSLAAECGISQPTARQWLTVLQASHLVALLPPYHRSFGKRLVKTPKLYFLDSGLLCHLLRITSPDELLHHALRGAVFETWVVSETLKHRFNRALAADLHFWRDNHGLEVDLVVEQGAQLQAVECKAGTSYSADWLGPVRRWCQAAGAAAAPPLLVYGGDLSHERPDHRVLSWQDLGWNA